MGNGDLELTGFGFVVVLLGDVQCYRDSVRGF